MRGLLARCKQERGSIIPLLIGLFAVVLTLLVVVIDLTALHTARVRLLDAGDAAAVDAADELADSALYGDGGGDSIALTDRSVRTAAERHLRDRPMPPGVEAWELGPGTGSPDGRTAVVEVRGRVRIPILTDVTDAVGGSVTVTVESRARARRS